MLDFQKAWIAHVALCRAQDRPQGDIVSFREGFDAARDQMVLGATNDMRLPGLPCQTCGRVQCGDECASHEWRPEKTEWGGEWKEDGDSPYPIYHSPKSVYYHTL